MFCNSLDSDAKISLHACHWPAQWNVKSMIHIIYVRVKSSINLLFIIAVIVAVLRYKKVFRRRNGFCVAVSFRFQKYTIFPAKRQHPSCVAFCLRLNVPISITLIALLSLVWIVKNHIEMTNYLRRDDSTWAFFRGDRLFTAPEHNNGSEIVERI